MDEALAPFRAEAQRLFWLLWRIANGLKHSIHAYRRWLSKLESDVKRWFVFEAHKRALSLLKEEETRGRNYAASGFKRDWSNTGSPIEHLDRTKHRRRFVVMPGFVKREQTEESRGSGWTNPRQNWSWRNRAIYSFSARILTLLEVLKDPDHTLARTTKQWLDYLRLAQDRARWEQAQRDKAQAAQPGPETRPTYISISNDLSTDEPDNTRWPYHVLRDENLPEPET